MAISYDAPSNTITVTGYTEETPCTFLDVWNADQAGGWGVVSKQGAVQFLFDCKLQIGDGSTETWFADINKEILLENGISTATKDWKVYVKNNAHFRIGKLEDATAKTGSQGCSIVDLESTYEFTDMIGGHWGSDVELYASMFSAPNMRVDLEFSSTVTIYGCFATKNIMLHSTTLDLYKCSLCSGDTEAIYNLLGVIDSLFISDYESAINLYNLATDVTYRDLTVRSCSYVSRSFVNTVADLYLIDADVDSWAFVFHSSATGKVYRQYTFNLKVVDKNGTPINGATATLHDKDGNQIFQVQTGSDGTITEQTVTRGYYDQTHGDALQDYAPFKLTLKKPRYAEQTIKGITLDAPFDGFYRLKGTSLVSRSPRRRKLLEEKKYFQTWRVQGYRLNHYDRVWSVTGTPLYTATRTWKLEGEARWLDSYDYLMKKLKEMTEMSFARWETFDACCLEQTGLGHTAKTADEICKGIMKRAEDGTLYKAVPPMEVVKSGDDIVTYGPATWEMLDREGDFITTEAQVNYLRRLFKEAAYKTIMDEHHNFQAGEPLLSYTTEDGKTYHSHVHEKAMMLVGKVRPDDGFEKTRELRKKILAGVYKSYSIAGRPVRYEERIEKGQKIVYHYDIQPDEAASYCREGVNPRAKFQVVQKSVDVTKMTMEEIKERLLQLQQQRESLYHRQAKLYPHDQTPPEIEELNIKIETLNSEIRALEQALGQILVHKTPKTNFKKLGFEKIEDLQKPFADYKDFADCVSQNQSKDDPEAYCASIHHQATGKWPTEKSREPRVPEDSPLYQALTREREAKKPATVDEIKKIIKQALRK